MKAVVYIRTCGNNTARFASAEKQYETIKIFCQTNGIEIAVVFAEDSIATPFEREAFNDMITYLQKHKGIKYVLCYKYVNLTADTNEFVRAMIAFDDLDCEIQVAHLKAFDLRKDTPQYAKWIELN